MSSTLHTTKGIVVRTVHYGETSMIVAVYTELFGLQSYIVQGVRTSSKKGSGKANYFQHGALLELVVYHNELKQLNRIKEFRWCYLYQHLLADVFKNSVLLFMMELVQKCIKQPEHNPDLFDFLEDALVQLDTASPAVTANYPLYFALHFTSFFGFQMNMDGAATAAILDLQEGHFTNIPPNHLYYADGADAAQLQELMLVMQPHELASIQLNQQQRRRLLDLLQTYYALHISEFGTLKTLPVLYEVLA